MIKIKHKLTGKTIKTIDVDSLREADLREADLQWANLRNADLRRANIREADLDFSCWPLWCGSFGVKADDRLVAQLIHHICQLDTSQCSGGVKESMDRIRKMAITDLFKEYRDDI